MKIVFRVCLHQKWIKVRQTKTIVISGPFYAIVIHFTSICNYPHVVAATWPCTYSFIHVHVDIMQVFKCKIHRKTFYDNSNSALVYNIDNNAIIASNDSNSNGVLIYHKMLYEAQSRL